MGLSLLANLSAYDLGYLSAGLLLDRTLRTVDSMEQLERHRGHFLNWYDTIARKALRPLYVSTVDSGNLVGHVRVLARGLEDLRDAPLLPANARTGLSDTFGVLSGLAAPGPELGAVGALLAESGSERGLIAQMAWLRALAAATAILTETFDAQRQRAAPVTTERRGGAPLDEVDWWSSALDRQVRAFLTELMDVAPWLLVESGPLEEPAHSLVAALDTAPDLRTLGERAAAAAAAFAEEPQSHALACALRQGAVRIHGRLAQIEALAQRCRGLTDADFTFLYDSRRKLLSIGYWVAERRLDNSAYDLLASEARLASYVAIAAGQIPFDHWFALGRRLTTSRNTKVLLSWSGSMFEYLMPRLIMPSEAGTLLDQTCNAAVDRQIEYGRQRGVPWGLSESCHAGTDSAGTYQYRAFGVPGLGLQRGLADELVVAPYATLLALLVRPALACDNLRRLADAKCLGPYGFYEALDFTPGRVASGERFTRVSTFMAHHHGMGLLALAETILGPQMQQRFLRIPEYRAAALLLQERPPKSAVVLHPHAREAQSSRRMQIEVVPPVMRVFTHPNTPVPEVHLLSNGRYHVMVSSAGAGYSRWGDFALTRWREDPTSECFGVFTFVGDVESRHRWSNTFQPSLKAGRQYEAVFTPGRAKFRRQDDRIETHTEIAVSTEDDVEIRRVRLTNRSERTRQLLVTSYAEVVLAPGIADEMHRTFSNLFVETEHLADQQAVLVTRRARSAEERPPFMFAMLLNTSAVVDEPPQASSCETDRARFIGRGRSLREPAAMEDWGPLSGTVGRVLDPCLAFRRPVRVPVEGWAQVDLVMGAAPTRADALALIAKYQDHRMADRVFEVAPTHSRAVLGHLGASEAEAQRYDELASAVIFPVAACRAPASLLRRNHKGQSGLWGYALSGDLPIVLVRATDPANLPLVRELLRAHAYWRLRGLAADLVIWNEDASGYRNVLGDDLTALIAAGASAQWIDKPSGVFVRDIDQFSEEDRVLLLAVARVVISDSDGTLEVQLERWRRAALSSRTSLLAPLRTTHPSPTAAPKDTPTPRSDLLFANGIGGFTQDGREYIIDLPPGQTTPAPWANVISNARLGTVISESGSAYTWYRNAHSGRLTPWHNDAVSGPSGEALHVRDESSGRSFSPMPWLRSGETGYTCRHGFGYSVFEHAEDGLESRLTTFVAINAPVKFLVLRLRNKSTRTRRLGVFGAFDLVLGDLRSKQAMHIVTELEPLTGAVLARNHYNADFAGAVAFFDCSEPIRTVSGDRAEILGRNGDPACPAALRLRQLSGHLGPGLDPCAAMHTRVELAPGATHEVVFVLGAGESTAEAVSLLRNYHGTAAARVALTEVWKYWNDTLGVIYAETPDAALNIMVNGWLPYQVLSCRLWGRSGFYQSGGAYGFRDQLQDTLALLHEVPELARDHLLRCAGRQFVEGDVQHWWHPPGGRGVRTHCSDDLLWLPHAVCRYVAFTGDTGILNEPVPYLTGRILSEREESYYDLPGRSEQVDSLYGHCVRAIQKSARRGPHGLPLIAGGDWNDGMNRVGSEGRGESVWLGFFLRDVLARFAPVARQRLDHAFASQCEAWAADLEVNLEASAWDGGWYRRAWFDNGQVLGSAENAECRIDSLPQSWATLAEVGSPERRSKALDAVWEQLVCTDDELVKLFAPPFDDGVAEPGYIKGYPPGVRENGGQYTHAAIWAAMAFAHAGRNEQAFDLLKLLNPIRHALDPEAVSRYKVEPYVVSADIYSEAPHVGRGGWTWYTGSAAWLYRLIHESIFGLDRAGDTLQFHPRVPAAWAEFQVHYRNAHTFYHISFHQSASLAGVSKVTLDGATVPDGRLRLADDRVEHAVEVHFGPPVEGGQQETERA